MPIATNLANVSGDLGVSNVTVEMVTLFEFTKVMVMVTSLVGTYMDQKEKKNVTSLSRSQFAISNFLKHLFCPPHEVNCLPNSLTLPISMTCT